MTAPVVIYWPPATGNEATIASIQSVAADGFLQLNPNVQNVPNTFSFDKIVRRIAFRSISDNDAVNFLVTGTGFTLDGSGNPTSVLGPITDTVQGPTAGFMTQSTKAFKTITSIQVKDNAATAIRVGFGLAGVTDYVFLDTNRNSFQASVQLDFISRTALLATVYQSLTKPETPSGQDYGKLIPAPNFPAFAVAPNLTGASTDQIGLLGITTAAYIASAPMAITWANMSATAADSLYFTVIQQGIL